TADLDHPHPPHRHHRPTHPIWFTPLCPLRRAALREDKRRDCHLTGVAVLARDRVENRKPQLPHRTRAVRIAAPPGAYLVDGARGIFPLVNPLLRSRSQQDRTVARRSPSKACEPIGKIQIRRDSMLDPAPMSWMHRRGSTVVLPPLEGRLRTQLNVLDKIKDIHHWAKREVLKPSRL